MPWVSSLHKTSLLSSSKGFHLVGWVFCCNVFICCPVFIKEIRGGISRGLLLSPSFGRVRHRLNTKELNNRMFVPNPWSLTGNYSMDWRFPSCRREPELPFLHPKCPARAVPVPPTQQTPSPVWNARTGIAVNSWFQICWACSQDQHSCYTPKLL